MQLNGVFYVTRLFFNDVLLYKHHYFAAGESGMV